MQLAEMAVWSASAGAIALVILVCLFDYALVRHVAALQGAAYNAASLLFVLLLSGMARALLPGDFEAPLRTAQVLVGALCVALGDLWVRGWLSAQHRDRLMDVGLLCAGTAIPLFIVASLFLPVQQQLPIAAGLVLLNTGLMVWMSVRGWLLGDALALGICVGSLLMLPSVGGLYAMALGFSLGVGWQAAIACACALCVSVIGFMLWQRNRHARRVRGVEDMQSQYDPVTKLPSGLPLVRELLRAQKRRKRTRREGAVVAVLLFEPERIRQQVGAAGLNEVYLHVAQRLQRQVGVVNPVGRYWDRCFVALVETIHAPTALRTLGLKVASSLRRPIQITHEGHPVHLRVDVGVGVVHLGRESAAVEDLLHDAQHLAEAARVMPSRAATRDAGTGEVVPVEHAQLGARRPVRHAGHRGVMGNRVRA